MRALLSIGAAARRLGLSVDTVRALVQTGELEDIRTSGGHRRFDPALLDAHMARHSGRGTRRSHALHELINDSRERIGRPLERWLWLGCGRA